MFSCGLIRYFIIEMNNSGGGIEDFGVKYRQIPVTDAYWSDESLLWTKVEVRLFTRGSGLSSIHCMGL